MPETNGLTRDTLLAEARAHAAAGRLDRAYSDLRAAIGKEADYAFLARAARLLGRLKKQAPPPSARKAKIALVCSTTTEFLAPILDLACFRDYIDAQIYRAPFGNHQQAVLDAGSDLYAFRPDFVLVLTNWRDANLAAFSPDPDAEVARVTAECSELWRALLSRLPCRVIQHTFDLPADDPNGHVGFTSPGARARVLRAINQELYRNAPPEVALLDLDHVSGLCGKRKWFDRTYWHATSQYPGPAALPLLVDHHVALVRAALGLSKKVLVLDLDNTLWGGVVGEDGVGNLRVGPPSAVGEAHAALQAYAAELRARGVILAVCSKNNPADALLPFEQHDAMILRATDFTVFKANWADKPANLREIAAALNLGLDSFVFLDDDPVERALVRRECPGVAVPEVGRDPADFVRALDSGLYFESWILSQEDVTRVDDYRVNASREQLRDSATSLDEFLRSLGMTAECGTFNDAVLGRVVQLIGKTNQFNLTGRRHSEAAVRDMMASPGWWTQYIKLKDRFGDSGLIGVMIARADNGGGRWAIDTWVMSCRVIGRRVEDLMLKRVWEAARAAGATELEGCYLPSTRNALVADLYDRFGFRRQQGTGGEGIRYLLDVRATAPPQVAFIHDRQA